MPLLYYIHPDTKPNLPEVIPLSGKDTKDWPDSYKNNSNFYYVRETSDLFNPSKFMAYKRKIGTGFFNVFPKLFMGYAMLLVIWIIWHELSDSIPNTEIWGYGTLVILGMTSFLSFNLERCFRHPEDKFGKDKYFDVNHECGYYE